ADLPVDSFCWWPGLCPALGRTARRPLFGLSAPNPQSPRVRRQCFGRVRTDVRATAAGRVSDFAAWRRGLGLLPGLAGRIPARGLDVQRAVGGRPTARILVGDGT